MLGLADRALILDVIEAALKGTPSIALEIMDDLYKKGADPIVVLQDMLEISHMLTKHRALPQNKDMTTLPKGEQERLENLADSLSMPSLGRTWQILLKGLGEVNIAPNPQKAAEMVVIRLIYAADLPDPADLIKKIKAHKDTGAMPPQGVSNTATSAAPVAQLTTTPAQPPSTNVNAAQETTPQETSGQATAALAQTAPDFAQINTDNITSMEDIVALLEQNGDMILAMHVRMYAHLVKIQEQTIEFRQADNAPERLSQDLGQKLKAITGKRWIITLSNQEGQPTLAQQADQAHDALRTQILEQPLVKNILQLFPEAKLKEITNKD